MEEKEDLVLLMIDFFAAREDFLALLKVALFRAQAPFFWSVKAKGRNFGAGDPKSVWLRLCRARQVSVQRGYPPLIAIRSDLSTRCTAKWAYLRESHLAQREPSGKSYMP